MKTETTLDQMKLDSDWDAAFKLGTQQDLSHPCESCGDGCDLSSFTLDDVSHIIGSVNGENDERDWVAVGRLADGRFFKVTAGCDYTGWDCCSGGSRHAAYTVETLIRFGLTDSERERLGCQLKD